MDGRGGAAVRLPLVQSQHGPAGGILGYKEDHLAVQGVLPLGVGEGDQIYPRVLELPGQGGVVLRQKGGAVLQPQLGGKKGQVVPALAPLTQRSTARQRKPSRRARGT